MQQIVIVAAAIINSNKELLLLKRRSDAKRSPDKWELPSGKVNYGEEPTEALTRIVQLTTGLQVSIGNLLASGSTISKTNQKHVLIFYYRSNLAKQDNPHSTIQCSNEHQEIIWANNKLIQQLQLEKHLKNMIFKIKKYLRDNINVVNDASEQESYSHLIINTDGGSRGNPGPSASGFVIMDEKQRIIEEGGEYLGLTTNNQAEYQAVKLALIRAKKYRPSQIDFRIDSLLVVNQMNGKYKIRNRELWPINEYIKNEIKQYDKVEFIHVPREMNVLADAKVNEVLDSEIVR